MKKICERCGSELYLNHDTELVCTTCLGIELLSNEKSSEICEQLIKKTQMELRIACGFLSFESLIDFGCWLRENEVKYKDEISYSINIGRVIFGTLLIKKALNGWHSEFDHYLLQELINAQLSPYNPLERITKNLRDIVQLRYNKVLIQEDCGLFVKYSDLLKSKTEMKYILEDDEEYVFLANMLWLDYRKNLEEHGISHMDHQEQMHNKGLMQRRIEQIKKHELNKNDFKKLSEKLEFEKYKRIYNGLNYIYPDPEMYAFKEIDNNPEVMNFFGELCSIAKKGTDTLFLKFSKSNFFKIADKYSYNSNKLYEMFVSSKSNIKNFPILIVS